MHGASNVVCPLMLRAAVPVVFFPVICLLALRSARSLVRVFLELCFFDVQLA